VRKRLRGIGSSPDAGPAGPGLAFPAVDTDLAAELVAMTDADHAAQAGALEGTVEEQLAWRRVTAANGDRLLEILEARGWPAADLVGERASQCAWLVA
jgi:hypothetical protein